MKWLTLYLFHNYPNLNVREVRCKYWWAWANKMIQKMRYFFFFSLLSILLTGTGCNNSKSKNQFSSTYPEAEIGWKLGVGTYTFNRLPFFRLYFYGTYSKSSWSCGYGIKERGFIKMLSIFPVTFIRRQIWLLEFYSWILP